MLGDYFETFIQGQVESKRYALVSEVVRAALRLFEAEEKKIAFLTDELKRGEASGIDSSFHPDTFLKSLHQAHFKDE